MPFYPELARQTHIQGTVLLRVSTDGTRVTALAAESGPPLLVQAAKENVKTWQFKPHAPTSFEVTFDYKLFVPECDSECNCEIGKNGETESVQLRLPSHVELIAKTLLSCDPAVEVRHRK